MTIWQRLDLALEPPQSPLLVAKIRSANDLSKNRLHLDQSFIDDMYANSDGHSSDTSVQTSTNIINTHDSQVKARVPKSQKNKAQKNK